MLAAARRMVLNAEVGDRVQVTAKFRDDLGQLTDPTTVSVQFLRPSGEVDLFTSPDVIKDSVGEYRFSLVIDQAGRWVYRWVGVGVIDQASEKSFVVKRTAF
jgi:hypothetical protein